MLDTGLEEAKAAAMKAAQEEKEKIDAEEKEEQEAIETLIASMGDARVKSGGMNKTGYLIKLGSVRQNWLRRYFILENGTLSYHSDKNVLDCKGKYTLSNCVLGPDEVANSRINLTVKGHSGRKFCMQAENEQEAQDWKEAIASWIDDEEQ
jgi:hypothetical protein